MSHHDVQLNRFDCPDGTNYCEPAQCGFIVAPNPTICTSSQDCESYAEAGTGTCLVGGSNMVECCPRANPDQGTYLNCITDPVGGTAKVCSYSQPPRDPSITMPMTTFSPGRTTLGAHHQIR